VKSVNSVKESTLDKKNIPPSTLFVITDWTRILTLLDVAELEANVVIGRLLTVRA